MGKGALQKSLPVVIVIAALVAIGLSIPRFYGQPLKVDNNQPRNQYDFNGVTNVQGKSRDTQVQSDVMALRTQLEAYYSQGGAGSYPSSEQLLSSTWRIKNLIGMDEATAVLPGGEKLGSDAYSYRTTPDACDGVAVPCTSFVINATLHDGTLYTKDSLNY